MRIFEKARLQICFVEKKNLKMIKYEDFEKGRVEICTAEKK